MRFIDLDTQYQNLKTKIDARIKAVLNHGNYIMGPEVFELEERLAQYTGVNHAVTCANGTDALQLAMMTLDIGPGDAVFCPTFTFFSTAEVVAFCGATPVFVDSEKDTYNICPADLEKRIQATIAEKKLKPKAIISVDLFGLPANYLDIQALASTYGLKLVEDAAQGFGGSINGQRAGSFGDIATTSFFPAKPLCCYGDGGAVFTNSDEYAEKLTSFRVHGKGRDKYDNIRIGMNSRLDTIQAGVLLEKLDVFPEEIEKRNKVAERYNKLLSNDFVKPFVPDGYLSSWAQYTIRLRSNGNRQIYMDALKAENIPSAIYYGKSLHRQTALAHFCTSVDLYNSEILERQVFSLPMHPYLSENDQNKIAKVLNNVSL
jgi:dTDP-4-amino-4,6-dideoxygalactose transaminase